MSAGMKGLEPEKLDRLRKAATEGVATATCAYTSRGLYRHSDVLAMADRIATLEAEVVRLRDALMPFSTVGRIIDGPFGPALFAEDGKAFQSGCAWRENGVDHYLRWGDFRRARLAFTALAAGEG